MTDEPHTDGFERAALPGFTAEQAADQGGAGEEPEGRMNGVGGGAMSKG